ncbi:hypothetical protein [Modestobacter sp. Leaf380]|uniref:hypothetical protein n=1 Tax=Modestobacter sp. Leaf380 TaxID=1736356 RepID=UPI0012F7ED05|nr:hypothetical protein [Modestobacter sp. Leaf380]
MNLTDLGLGPVLLGTVYLAPVGSGNQIAVLADRQVVLRDGFTHVQTTTNGQTVVSAYPASRVIKVEDLRPAP